MQRKVHADSVSSFPLATHGTCGLSENRTPVLLIPTSGFDEQSTLFTALSHFEPSRAEETPAS